MNPNDTIVALATPAGAGAISVIRVSGKDAISMTAPLFQSIRGKALEKQASHTIHLGHLMDGERVLDQVLLSVFKAPHSYTGENIVEISCHGSPYIQQQIIQLLLDHGCRAASGGEFTLRAFLNGKLDLSQAEAVADLISSENEASHTLAIQQMRGGFSHEIKELRQQLLNFASLMELELDFAEEDVEFADRSQFNALLERMDHVIKRLLDSFALGNVLKNGIPVAIVGEPNVGKSTLLNALLNEERAIVSNIAGTTRDTIEDEMAIDGIGFRFIDTAGIRETQDEIEGLGIKKTYEKIEKAQIVLFLVDGSSLGTDLINLERETTTLMEKYPGKQFVLIINKTDQRKADEVAQWQTSLKEFAEGKAHFGYLLLAAKMGLGVDDLKRTLSQLVNTGKLQNNETLVTNSRHYDALQRTLEAIHKVQEGIREGLPGDLLAMDVREALENLGEITGEVTNDELLGNIFANFCIGK